MSSGESDSLFWLNESILRSSSCQSINVHHVCNQLHGHNNHYNNVGVSLKSDLYMKQEQVLIGQSGEW